MTTEQQIWDIFRHDPRYPVEAYQFVLDGLNFTQEKLGRVPTPAAHSPGKNENHISGSELVEGVCELARREFGFLAKVVFHQWGIRQSDDIGEIVFNMIESELLSKTESDSRADFHNLCNIDRALSEGFTINMDEIVRSKRGSR